MAPSNRLLLPSLPFELVEEILYKTPVESLLIFKSTCKQWYDLISNKRFMYNHLDRSPERFIRVDYQIQTVQIMDPVTTILSDSPIPNEFRGPFQIFWMVQCDGLMMCRYEELNSRRERYDNLAVWNPVLRKIKWIEPLLCYWRSDSFGIGYDNASRDNYKILRIGYIDNAFHCFKAEPKCEIYEFKSNSWRGIDAELDGDVEMELVGVSVKGNMYWIATKTEHFILSFDFSMETFKNICCPPFWDTRQLGCFNGDRLSLLLQHNEERSREIEVWMTNKLSDGVVSFSKYFNVTSLDLPALQLHWYMARPGHSVGKHRNIMAWCEGPVEEDGMWYTFIKFYEIDEGGMRKQIETGRYGRADYNGLSICSYVYVPSLIPVPE